MPSAASVKSDSKQQQQIGGGATATATAAANATAPAPADGGGGGLPTAAEAANATPLRQAITVIEHKIRNLEKRKSKLESYRDLQRSGKDLNQDQKTAVAKYDEVVQTLEFARDLCKQFLGIAVVSEKDEKKRTRKEAIARSQCELTKIREVLLVQDALTNMGQDSAREDFLNGKNGAATLSQNDLKLLDDLYTVVTPKHEAGDPTAFMPQVQAAAEHLLAVVDGKPKEVFGTTYSQIKEVIGKIHESGYLDQALESYAEEIPVTEDIAEPGEDGPPQMDSIPVQQQLESMSIESRQSQPQLLQMQPAPVEPQQLQVMQPPPQQQQQQQQQPPQMAPPQQAALVEPPPTMMTMQQQPPTQPVPEQLYYQQQQQPLPPPPQTRPISEVLGAGSFFFLQESELDTPPEQIPSQTFTNQQFVGGRPQPIPMPPHFQQFPNSGPLPPPQQQPQLPPQQQLLPPPIVPPVQMQQQPPQQQLPPQQPQVPPSAQPPVPAHQQQPQQTNNNGIGGDVHNDLHHDEVNRQRGGNRHPQQQQQQQQPQQQQQQQQPRSNNTNNQQTFFANNNGYNNRNNNRNRSNNGVRANNRHNQ